MKNDQRKQAEYYHLDVNEENKHEQRKRLDQLNQDVQKITALLIDIVRNDKDWWRANMLMLVGQPLNSLKEHLRVLDDTSLIEWGFSENNDDSYSILDPIEAIVWLASLCRLDCILIGVLPRRFVEDVELQWRVMALHWV